MRLRFKTAASLRLGRAAIVVALASAVMACTTAPGTGKTLPLNLSEGSPIIIGRSYSLPSAKLGDVRTINVQLPASYGDGKKHYPVVYLLDGGEREDFLHVAGIAQISAAYGAGEEVILVGIAGKDRRHDLTTPSSVPSDLKAAPTSGGALIYRRFLVDELKPWVEARYRTNGRAALMGESLGGLFTLQTLLSEPLAFTDYIAVSPSLWWNNGALVRDITERTSLQNFSNRNLWVGFDIPPPPESEARKDRARQDALERSLELPSDHGLTSKFIRFHESHDSIYHPAALQAFRDLFGRKNAT